MRQYYKWKGWPILTQEQREAKTRTGINYKDIRMLPPAMDGGEDNNDQQVTHEWMYGM
jgi:hypothetical protein